MPKKEEVKPDNGRVTQGIPSLDPSKRFQHDTALVSRDFTEKLTADREAKREDSVAPDGTRPRTVAEISRGTELTPEVLIARLSKLCGHLWFDRSKAAPSQMGVYLKIPVTIDSPEGLQYVGGFNADRAVKEWDVICVKKRWTHTREGFMREVEEQCSGCKKCIGLGCERGYRPLLFRLMEMKALTRTQVEKTFGAPNNSKNWRRAMNVT